MMRVLVVEKNNFMNTYAYLGNYKAITVTVNGHKIFLDTRELHSLSIVINGFYEEAVEWTIRKNLKRGDKAIDLGANIGYFSILMASIVGKNGTVFSFEPNPDVFKLLTDSILINGFKDRVKLHNKAVFNKTSKIRFTWAARHGGGHIIPQENEQKKGHVVDVEAVMLDSVIPKESLPINLMKIDVEGSEPFVIEGARKILNSSPDIKIIMEWDLEFMKKLGYKVEKLIDILKPYDFFVNKIERIGRLTGKLIPIKFEELLVLPHSNLLISSKNVT